MGVSIDTGSRVNLIHESLWKEMQPRPRIANDYLKIVTATGTPVPLLGTAQIRIMVGDVTISSQFYVARSLDFRVVLGIRVLLLII